MTPDKKNDPWRKDALARLQDEKDDQPVLRKPILTTRAANTFFEDAQRSFSVILLFTQVAIFSDNAAYVARKISDVFNDDLKGAEHLPKDYNPFVRLDSSPGQFQRRLLQLDHVLEEMVLVRVVDNFMSYLSNIIRECLKSRREIMRSNETVSYLEIFQAQTLDELHEALVERKVDALGYLGFLALAQWIDDRLGISLLQDFPAKMTLLEFIEIRNCIVHNRGLRSEKMAKALRVDQFAEFVGTKIELDLECNFMAAQAAAECVSLLDEVVATKFHIERRDNWEQ